VTDAEKVKVSTGIAVYTALLWVYDLLGSMNELAYLAAKAGLSENVVIDVALETVERFRYIWAKEKSNLPITSAMAAKIEKNAMAVKLYNESK
jgi:hypothetical protein